MNRLSEQADSEREQEIECPYLDTEALEADESDPEEARPPKRRRAIMLHDFEYLYKIHALRYN